MSFIISQLEEDDTRLTNEIKGIHDQLRALTIRSGALHEERAQVRRNLREAKASIES